MTNPVLRNLDNWSVYMDNEGQPLYGRLTFYSLHTTQKIIIYSESGTPLSNPMHTGLRGKTEQQVFLPNEDVTVYVEKYIGQGNMSDDERNLSAWVEQYTFDVLKNQYVTESETGIITVENVSTMDHLRDDEINASYVNLLGYYEQGDMPPVQYTKVQDSVSVDDGGSIIRVDSDTVWKLVPKQIIDCRVFGVFPSMDYLNITAYNAQLRLCFSYANSLGLSVYMPQVFEQHGYYYIEGANHTLNQKLYIDDGVVLYGKPGTSSIITVDEIEYYGDSILFMAGGNFGYITVNCPVVKSSWASPAWTTWQGVISTMLVDGFNTDVFEVKNCKAEIVKNIYNMNPIQFTNCQINGDKRIYVSNIKLHNCGYITDHQIGATSNVIELVDNKILITNVKDADTYVLWKNMQNESNYGDLLGKTLTNGYLLTGTVNISNFNGNVYLLSTARTELNISRFTGNIIFPSEAPPTLPLIYTDDSSIYISGTATALNGIIARRSNFAGTALGVFGPAYFENCTLDGVINVQGDLTCKSCTINSNLGQHNSGTINLYFANNAVNGTLQLYGDTIGTLIHATIINNNGTSEVPIGLDRTNLDPIDSDHTYTYSGNSGTFLPYVTKPVVHEYTIIHRSLTTQGSLQPPTSPYVLTQQVLGGADSDTNGTPNGYIFPWYYQPLFDQVKMFRIGTDRFQINAKFTTWPEMLELAGTSDEYKWNRYHDAQLGAYFIDGYTFGIMPYWADPSNPSLTSMSINPNFFKGSLSFSFNNMPSFTDYHMSMAISYECMDKHE